jgi:ABC-type branched-subunit amino acid transport system substrate-binding protein
MSDAVEAFMKWCNDQGGINGRKVVGKLYDAKILEVNNVMTEACKEVFMLVGTGFALDGLAEQTRVQCNLPAVPTYSVNPAFAHGPDVWLAVPNPVDFTPAAMAAQLNKLFPEKVKKTATMFANFASTIETKDKVKDVYPKFGFQFLDCDQQYNINGEADWKPFVQKLKDCGAEVVYFTGSPFPNFQNVLTAAAQLDYKPVWFTDANFYTDQMAQWNKDGLGDNVYTRVAIRPFEQADQSPATKQYMDLVTANGGKISGLGAQAASSFLLWATAAKACGSDLTRACMRGELDKVKSWDGGGLHTAANTGENLPPECGMLLKLDGTKWVQAAPATTGEYECDPSFVAAVGDIPAKLDAKLDANRRSTLFTGASA